MSTNVEQIKERLNIVDVISSYVKVEKAGINFRAKCPFHNEKTPSFFISPSRQSFYCFGCGEKGDIFSFVQKFEGLDFRSALKVLADRAGIELKNFREDGGGKEEKDELFEIMETAAEFYEKNLAENKSALNYLKKRGLTQDSISKWRIGFAKDEWRDLHDFLVAKEISREKMLEAGLIKKVSGDGKSASQEKYYDTFRDRVMFPIFDGTGRVIAFSGRTFKSNLPAEEESKIPKYLNSPETKLFYKSEVLYGFNVAKNHIRKLDYAVLVEGQMDLILSHQAGVFNTVASSGTALTELHLKKIQKLSNRIIVAYDSDTAGEKAGIRAAELALILGMEVKMASLPEGEDPASLVKDNPEKWKEALRKSEHLIEFALNKAALKNQGRNLTKEIIKSILPLVAALGSEMEKSQFVKKIALKARAPEEAVWEDLKKIGRGDVKVFVSDPKEAKEENGLERIAAGFVFLEESLGKSIKTKKKWREIVGAEEVERALENFESKKDILIFEAERHSAFGDPSLLVKDVMDRIELKKLKQDLKEAAEILDGDIGKKEKEETEKSLEKIQKRIKELSS